MNRHLYLLELFIATLCVGALTILLHRGFDVMVLKSFIVAFVAVALGLGVFWIYFVPRAYEPHQRTLSFITSIIVGMGVAPWVVEPLVGPFFLDRAESEMLFAYDTRRSAVWSRNTTGDVAFTKAVNDALRKKLQEDGFSFNSQGNTTTYSRRFVRIQLVEVFHRGEREGFTGRIGWRAQGLWFQVRAIEEEGRAYSKELTEWFDVLKER